MAAIHHERAFADLSTLDRSSTTVETHNDIANGKFAHHQATLTSYIKIIIIIKNKFTTNYRKEISYYTKQHILVVHL